MALPSNGKISLNDVRTELGITGPVSLGDSKVRGLAGITSGKISMKDLYGKQSIISEEFTMVPELYWGFLGFMIDTFGKINPQSLKNGAIIDSLYSFDNSQSSPSSYAGLFISKINDNYPKEYIIAINNESFTFKFVEEYDAIESFEAGCSYEISDETEIKRFHQILSDNLNKEIKIKISYK